jgi:hypothetical protein
MLKTILVALLPLLIFFGDSTEMSLSGFKLARRDANTGTLKKMIVARGNVAMDLNTERLNGSAKESSTTFRLEAEPDSFFTVLVFNDELRGPIPSAMTIGSKDSLLPGRLGSSGGQLSIENLEPTEPYELAVRDPRTGFTYFYVEGHLYDYNPADQTLYVQMGRLLLSREYATELGRPNDALATVGKISITATMRPIEVTQVVDGEVTSESMPGNAFPGTVPGPDVVVGDVNGLAQFGSQAGTQVGLALGTDSCNFGAVDLNWFQLPSNDHPVIPQNLYRMSGGATNDERFEQIAQSQVKHAFTALTNNICGLGCNGVGGTRLGSGCSDPYSASLNSGPNLGSKAWINPYTGFYPRGDSATPPNSHTGHTHLGPTHRMLTEVNDLNTSMNAGATYYAEGQYVTPHEFAWCQTNPGQCNMNNNVSYRRYNVTGTVSPFSFSPAAATVRQRAAISAWTGATLAQIQPDPANDGIGIVGYKVTNPSPGVWHYEYAIYNQNLDRGIQSFSVPIGGGSTVSNIGFKAPPQHPGSAADGTVGNAGFSIAAWAQNSTVSSVTWSSETLAQNANANAIRWGTLYNFRFDSDRAPQTVNATIGFYKTGAPITVQVQAPSGPAAAVSVSGRVTSSTGQSVYMARVTMTDGMGNVKSALTNPFGYYRFFDVASNATYTMGVGSKEYTFTSRQVLVNGNLTDVNFVAQ